MEENVESKILKRLALCTYVPTLTYNYLLYTSCQVIATLRAKKKKERP